MVNLNSVLLEGVLTDDAVSGLFAIRSSSRVNGGEESSVFSVKCAGALEQAVVREGRKGRGVRVVGKLRQDGEGVHIAAEHLEFRPGYMEESSAED